VQPDLHLQIVHELRPPPLLLLLLLLLPRCRRSRGEGLLGEGDVHLLESAVWGGRKRRSDRERALRVDVALGAVSRTVESAHAAVVGRAPTVACAVSKRVARAVQRGQESVAVGFHYVDLGTRRGPTHLCRHTKKEKRKKSLLEQTVREREWRPKKLGCSSFSDRLDSSEKRTISIAVISVGPAIGICAWVLVALWHSYQIQRCIAVAFYNGQVDCERETLV
jgi:hypothetical protein